MNLYLRTKDNKTLVDISLLKGDVHATAPLGTCFEFLIARPSVLRDSADAISRTPRGAGMVLGGIISYRTSSKETGYSRSNQAHVGANGQGTGT